MRSRRDGGWLSIYHGGGCSRVGQESESEAMCLLWLDQDYHKVLATWDAESGHGSRYNFRDGFTLGTTVRMKRLHLEGDDWSYRLVVEERWPCMHQSHVL